MKTLKQVLKDNSDRKSLINAVVNQLGGTDSIEDVNRNGIDGGYGKFVYYNDTHAFAMKHRKKIVAMLEEQAEEFGQEVVEMVSGFGVFRNSKMDNDDRKDLYKFLGGGKCEQSKITNLMAWFAAEEVCRMFED